MAAWPSVEQIVAAALSPSAMTCPKCGREYVVPGTPAARLHGVCPSCYYTARARALEQAAAERGLKRRYDAMRQRACRATQAAESAAEEERDRTD